MSRRGQIVMGDDELAAFLEEQRIVTCATLGRDGWPHLMPLWYLVREVLKEAGDAVVLEPADAREAVLAAAEGLIARAT